MIKQDSLFQTEDVTKSDRSLHTPGGFARKNLLYVQEVGHLQSLKPHRCIREKLDSFLFLVVLKGRGALEINNRHYDLQQGDCAFIDCMEHYEHISDEQDGWTLAWVHFNGFSARGYYELFLKHNAGNVFPVTDVAPWNEIICNLQEKQKEKRFIAELESGELLINLLNRVMRSIEKTVNSEDESEKQMVNDLREFLNEQYAQQNILSELPDGFGTDFDRLNHLFQRYVGIGVEEYIDNRRLNAAKELLRFTIKPLDEVAAESGLGDVRTLQQMFGTGEGMTAEEYRMKWAQWIR